MKTPMILVQIEYVTGTSVSKLFSDIRLARKFWAQARDDFASTFVSINWA